MLFLRPLGSVHEVKDIAKHTVQAQQHALEPPSPARYWRSPEAGRSLGLSKDISYSEARGLRHLRAGHLDSGVDDWVIWLDDCLHPSPKASTPNSWRPTESIRELRGAAMTPPWQRCTNRPKEIELVYGNFDTHMILHIQPPVLLVKVILSAC